MINFECLRFVAREKYSFVGIKKTQKTVDFYLPKGFEKIAIKKSAFNEKRDLFFLFYKVINTFREICAERGYLEDNSKLRTQDRDGVIKSNSGSGIKDNQEETENIFYSKLDIIGSLLNAYDEPKILALAYRLGKSDKFDVSKIHRYLHQAIYLSNNAAYVDQMTLPKKVIQFESTDIVAMYCYLFYEVRQQLQESVTPEIASLAESFRQHYLSSQDSIFDEQTYEQTLNTLKDALETIDHNTPIKDADYWQYYEAIELFLYGDFSESEDGEIWGISNFWSVWESMCLTYLVQNTDPSLLLQLDTQYLSSQLAAKVKLSKGDIDISDAFITDKSNRKKDLKPDAILYEKKQAQLRNKDIDKPNLYFRLRDISTRKSRFQVFPNGNYSESFNANIVKIEENLLEDCEHIYSNLKNEDGIEIYNYTSRLGYPVENLEVSHRISETYYSYWELEDTNNSDCIQWMRYLNHLFYIALVVTGVNKVTII